MYAEVADATPARVRPRQRDALPRHTVRRSYTVLAQSQGFAVNSHEAAGRCPAPSAHPAQVIRRLVGDAFARSTRRERPRISQLTRGRSDVSRPTAAATRAINLSRTSC
ncbi:MAG: hypothetical protein DWH97_13100 [Planctomycetota bacterium]|nr:MAG: hypothetical protein DWH97_13100 [Planctomycetota bacterium]RLS95114.1 MAG: hypothetical protein DWI12_04915 [Planctomycetota bacterium]